MTARGPVLLGLVLLGEMAEAHGRRRLGTVSHGIPARTFPPGPSHSPNRAIHEE